MHAQQSTGPEVVFFTAPDGVPIACYRSGAGPALVAVHGTAADHTAWVRVTPLLARHFTVYAMDRRGRGASGDAPDYGLEREFADVAAVVEGIGQPVHLYGHSFGGACATEAATRVGMGNLASLILYEGMPKPLGLRGTPDELIGRLETLIGAGQREEALSLFMLTAVGLTPPELEVYRQSPAWPARVAAVHTIPRELRAFNDYGTDLERFRTLSAPTLLLIGERTRASRRELFESFTRLSTILPRSQIRELPGQGHTAHETAPELLAEALTAFVLATEREGSARAAAGGRRPRWIGHWRRRRPS